MRLLRNNLRSFTINGKIVLQSNLFLLIHRKSWTLILILFHFTSMKSFASFWTTENITLIRKNLMTGWTYIKCFKFEDDIEIKLARRTEVGVWRPMHVTCSFHFRFIQNVGNKFFKHRISLSWCRLLIRLIRIEKTLLRHWQLTF